MLWDVQMHVSPNYPLVLAWCCSSKKFTFFNTVGPAHWPKLWKHQCAGRKQSPINIPITTTKYVASLKKSLHFKGYSCHACKGKFELENKGTKLEVFVESAGASIRLNGIGNFKLREFHFHWGKVNSRGSEHRYGGKAYSAEVSCQKPIWKWLSSKLKDVFPYDNFHMCLRVYLLVNGYHPAAQHPIVSY